MPTDPPLVALLAALPGWGFGLALVLCRVGAACIMLPGVGEAEMPATVRMGFALGFTVLLLPVVAPLLPPLPTGVAPLAGMVAAEVATGLWLGWLPRLVVQALPVAAQFAATMIGLSSVLQPDPELGPQTTAMSRLFAVAAPVALFASGLYALPLAALAGSFHLIAPGTLLPVVDSVPGAVAAVTTAFALAVRLAAPFIVAGLLWQCALGLLARLVPNLQVLAASLPGQLLLGLVLLALFAAGMVAAWQDQLRPMLAHLPAL